MRLKEGVADAPVAGQQAAAEDFVVGPEFDLAGGGIPELLDESEQVGGVDLAGMGGDAGGEVAIADEEQAGAGGELIGGDAFDVAAILHGEIDDHGSGAKGVEHGGGEEERGATAEDLGGGEDDVGVLAEAGEGVALPEELIVGEGPGVAPSGFTGLA